MKAVYFKQHGGSDLLQVGELPTPNIATNGALIKVEACALNHLDLWVRQGLPGVQIPMPHIGGSEIVGIIAGKGPRVKGVRVGQRVLVAPGISCRRCAACRMGRDSLCPDFRIVGLQINGGYAEYASVPGRNLIPVSNRWKPEEWAAVPLVFLTAWHMLITRAALKPRETVLVQGAGSGVGSAAIQIAKLKRCTVFATASSEEKAKKARSLGADVVLNTGKGDFAEELLKATKGRGVDVVFEHIGPATWAGSVRCLARGGRLVTCGATTGPKVELDLRFFFTKELNVLGCTMGSRRELNQVLALVARGKLRPVVSKVFPLHEAAKAQGMMESRNFFGKLVLKVL